ncbi:hypothetical protein RHCRD62_90227 [Rhodococcus sp. RD6.2]|nr:hypothetical protein RHCRD62_90227 [Rhodococcus sp. RD6.2]
MSREKASIPEGLRPFRVLCVRRWASCFDHVPHHAVLGPARGLGGRARHRHLIVATPIDSRRSDAWDPSRTSPPLSGARPGPR